MKNIINSIRNRIRSIAGKAHDVLSDSKGEVAVNTIGAIIIAVVVIGLLVVAINAFFPGFFTGMFNSMQTKLNANW